MIVSHEVFKFFAHIFNIEIIDRSEMNNHYVDSNKLLYET
jgi:hypothetical protein